MRILFNPWKRIRQLEKKLDELTRHNAQLMLAIHPTANTKATHMGEYFEMLVTKHGACTRLHRVPVSWDTFKAILANVRKDAGLG